ncbi:hypothetical protein D3C81_2206550 [compost metagenome]
MVPDPRPANDQFVAARKSAHAEHDGRRTIGVFLRAEIERIEAGQFTRRPGKSEYRMPGFAHHRRAGMKRHKAFHARRLAQFVAQPD